MHNLIKVRILVLQWESVKFQESDMSWDVDVLAKEPLMQNVPHWDIFPKRKNVQIPKWHTVVRNAILAIRSALWKEQYPLLIIVASRLVDVQIANVIIFVVSDFAHQLF